MCYANMITWMECGHFRVIQQMCSEAKERSPPSLCLNAHEPVATDIDAAHGVCPDLTKHPLSTGQERPSQWAVSMGIERTSGKGKGQYRTEKA